MGLPWEGQTMKTGEIITAETFDNKLIECRFVAAKDQTALVCGEDEWQQAQKENREPECLGWPLSSVQTKRGRHRPRLGSDALKGSRVV